MVGRLRAMQARTACHREGGRCARRGRIGCASASRLQALQAALFDRTPAASVPLAILLDESNRAVAIYRGALELEQVLEDWRTIRGADEKQLYHLAPPMKGTWFTNPLPQAEVDRVFLGS